MKKKFFAYVLISFLMFGCGDNGDSVSDVEDIGPGDIYAELDGCSYNDPTYDSYVPQTGCTCKSEWTYDGNKICGGKCALLGNHTPWCYTTNTCYGMTWSYCKEDEDACEPPDSRYINYVPSTGCTCQSVWTYNGKKICNSKCADPANEGVPWCFTKSTCYSQNWSYCSVKS